MQICDSLALGGLERMAVNIANSLAVANHRSFLCATRAEGPLRCEVDTRVELLKLERRGRFDLGAIRRLAAFVRDQGVEILHAHGTALFMAVAAARLAPGAVVVWHDHFGRHERERRPVWLYGLATGGVGGVISVSRPLAEWAATELQMERNRVWYVPNFVVDMPQEDTEIELPGGADARIVCVANLRPEKDHENLLRAMRFVLGARPKAHLLVVGDGPDPEYLSALMSLASKLGIAGRVAWLGRRSDVRSILRRSTVGVLSSASEAFPLALLEYAAAGLPTVATRVGECAEVLGNGEAGILVPPSNPEALATGLVSLLGSGNERVRLGIALRERWSRHYSPAAALERITAIYDTVLSAAMAQELA